MATTIRVKDYANQKDTEYKEVDERNPLPVVIAGGVIGGTGGDIPVFDGNINIKSVGGETTTGTIRVALTDAQAAALRSPDTQAVSGTVTIGNQQLEVMLMNDTLDIVGAVEVTNDLNVTLKNPSVPVTDNGGSLTVDGTVTVGNSNLPVTFTNTSIVVSDGGEALTVKGSVALTNATIPVTDGGGSLTVDGAVEVTNFPAPVTSVAVSNFPAPVTSVAVNNFPAPVTSVAVNNQPTVYPVTDNNGSLTVDGTIAATQSGTWTFTPSGTQSVSANAPALTASSTAMTAFRNPAVSSTPVQVRSGGGRVHKYHFGNPNGAIVFVHMYNALAANVTVGTTTPLMSYMVAPNAALDGFWPNSVNYSTGISVAVTTTATGNTAPTTGVLVNLGYL